MRSCSPRVRCLYNNTTHGTIYRWLDCVGWFDPTHLRAMLLMVSTIHCQAYYDKDFVRYYPSRIQDLPRQYNAKQADCTGIWSQQTKQSDCTGIWGPIKIHADCTVEHKKRQADCTGIWRLDNNKLKGKQADITGKRHSNKIYQYDTVSKHGMGNMLKCFVYPCDNTHFDGRKNSQQKVIYRRP